MRKEKRYLLVLLLGLMLLPLMAEKLSAQGMKIGYVRDERIQKEFKPWAKAQDQFNVDAKAWEDEALAKQQELAELLDEYEKQKLILSDEKKQEKEATFNAKKDALDAFTRQIYGPNGKAERRQSQLLEPLLQTVNKAIEAVAIEGNYDIVFTLQSGLAYIKEEFDVTDKVIKYLEDNPE
ncbi:MAG: OmpH family outer membrane protein [candidate division Zixibacteria bacterium]